MFTGILPLLLKPLSQITPGEIESIATAGVLEDAQTEFKEAVPEKEKARSWAEKGDLSEYGRNSIIAEIIAFGNAFGGTLYIGIEETDTEPKRSRTCKPVPQVAKLAAKLENSMRDCIEPRLLTPEIVPIITNEATGAGVLVIRVPPSPIAPHWNRAERKAYRRIGTSAQAISMLDIQSITLERARTSSVVEYLFEERRRAFEKTWNTYGKLRATRLNVSGWSPESALPPGFAVRCTAVPTMPARTVDVTSREDLKIKPEMVLYKHANQSKALSFPFIAEKQLFRPALRSWRYEHHGTGAEKYQYYHLVRGDGVLESVLMSIPNFGGHPRLPVEFLFALAFGMIFAVEQFRVRTGIAGIAYELELEVYVRGDTDVAYFQDKPNPGVLHMAEATTLFPRYLLEGRGQAKQVIDGMQHDIWNAMGRQIDAQHIERIDLDLPLMWQVIDKNPTTA